MLEIRILVVSNVPGAGDSAVSSLEVDGATIVAKETGHDARALAKYSGDFFASGNYDAMVVISDNPTATDVALRRHEGIVATVCRDIDDARSARENDANTIVLKAGDSTPAGDIIGAFMKGGGFRPRLRVPAVSKAPMQHSDPAAEQPQHHVHAPQDTVRKIAFRPKDEPVAQQEPYEEPQMPKRPGVGGWLKDALGIVDVEKPKTDAKDHRARQKPDKT